MPGRIWPSFFANRIKASKIPIRVSSSVSLSVASLLDTCAGPILYMKVFLPSTWKKPVNLMKTLQLGMENSKDMKVEGIAPCSSTLATYANAPAQG